jgi:hypothetical protein
MIINNVELIFITKTNKTLFFLKDLLFLHQCTFKHHYRIYKTLAEGFLLNSGNR